MTSLRDPGLLAFRVHPEAMNYEEALQMQMQVPKQRYQHI